MLILGRFIGQAIYINGNISVKVLGLNADNSVRLGVEAPREIAVHREEVYLKECLKRDEGV